ncbi:MULTISPECIES: ParB/RepB/Spo0J family partition protein [unclassified Paenibacillus]|uniref:ParB/RepB/Spo0J family partition protein n=1 Tax=unclassified Paenibacillus TaxID=185978 RepID=UPI0024056533|nr:MULTISPECIES: ParB/RepB/Spo0J family partition protein [unclassified Paenibacillus]MDF9839704.1 ParB family chromosome partitioning protein [Paenibacillus sp. PastF-2]MDF9846284.1 ParB family chromosome partitioning protein [Paenibacillus sp. PastM-2]MDF9853366.1 ParB family chromosome partitioning protein [Paenibacillus sp. PastF-1]MDH6478130.1 ParB family chromosome partitioning protein [Paenibacillus sp. PastH-2]MDH6506371.1 ParB family chromosome partitioning protein [Paenibacillus sp. 
MSKRLGKGLDALIPSLSINEDDKVVEIPLGQLRANPYQPRKDFNEEAIQELAESIRQHGVIQPIIVRSVLKGYEIIAGERRFRASQYCGKTTIPAVVRSLSDQQVMEIALIENLQRENLNAMEIAVAYQGLMDQFSLTQEELSLKVGKSRSHIANFLRLLTLPEEVKDYVSRGTISMGHARAIVGLKDPEIVKQLAEQCVEQQWSVRQLEEVVKNLDRKPAAGVKAKVLKRDPYIDNVEEGLRERFKTTVKIKQGKDKGKIEINYYSAQDLERLLELLGN